MKDVTVVKILKRYAKGLQAMENEARQRGVSVDEEHYRTDRVAMEIAIKLIEKRKENT